MIFVFFSCSNKLTDCFSWKESTARGEIKSKIDSVFIEQGIECEKKKIIESKCKGDTLLILRVNNSCYRSIETFFFDKDLNVLKVVHTLQQLN
jgi:hypothetical protein